MQQNVRHVLGSRPRGYLAYRYEPLLISTNVEEHGLEPFVDRQILVLSPMPPYDLLPLSMHVVCSGHAELL